MEKSDTQQNVGVIPMHFHNGNDSPQLNPINFLGFRIDKVALATTAPTDTPIEGTIRFLYDVASPTAHYVMWIRINKSWKYVNLS